ncbi:alpha/beta fold hydrolase, partial [Psychroserpens sp.]|uniref:alpha/beta fold hydrolase n=1 Tax=Psychroserpens sp. TaxID=2020870 RepID=UPI003C74F7F8
LDGIKEALQNDRVGFLKEFSKGFYSYDDNKDKVSQGQLDYDFIVASHASPKATIQTALAWMHTDFRSELKNVNVPTLIIHGDADATVPMETSAKQAHEGIENSTLEIIKGAPHGLNITHSDELNELLINFLKK